MTISNILAIIGGLTIWILMVRFMVWFFKNILEDELNMFEITLFSLFAFIPYGFVIIPYYLTYPIWKPIDKFIELENRVKKLEKKRRTPKK